MPLGHAALQMVSGIRLPWLTLFVRRTLNHWATHFQARPAAQQQRCFSDMAFEGETRLFGFDLRITTERSSSSYASLELGSPNGALSNNGPRATHDSELMHVVQNLCSV